MRIMAEIAIKLRKTSFETSNYNNIEILELETGIYTIVII